MSTTTLSLIVLGGVILFILITAISFVFIKRSQYQKEIIGKIKCVFLPRTTKPYSKVIKVEPSGNMVAAPNGHVLPRYFFDKENTWLTNYPDNPFLGLGVLQVQIATVWYFEDNPEPITSHPMQPIATASMIFAAIDSAFALVVHELEEELQKTKKALMDALATKLNKTVVYALLVIILISVIIDIYFNYSNGQSLKLIKSAVGK